MPPTDTTPTPEDPDETDDAFTEALRKAMDSTKVGGLAPDDVEERER